MFSKHNIKPPNQILFIINTLEMEVKNTINNETASEKLISNELLWRWFGKVMRTVSTNDKPMRFAGVEVQ